MRLRGVVHCRSQHSDAECLPLPELKKELFGHGLSFCCVTESAAAMSAGSADAFVAECHQLSDQAFVFIPGFEVAYENHSLLLIGTGVFMGRKIDDELLPAWREVTPLVFAARTAQNGAELPRTLLSVIDGMEVWNEELDGPHAPHAKTLRAFQSLKLIKSELKVIGGIGGSPYQRGGPEIEIEADSVNSAEIIRQLTLGFYTVTDGHTKLQANGTFQSGGGLWTWCRGLLGRLRQMIRRSTQALRKAV